MRVRWLRASVSDGCSSLNHELKLLGYNSKKLSVSRSRYRGKIGDVVINWGSTDRKNINPNLSILNEPEAVVNSSDKLKTFQILSDNGMNINLPKWVTSLIGASSLFTDEMEDAVYCRTLTRASEGRGIVIANSVDELIPSPLFTCKVPIKRELRVHVFKDKVIDFSQKKKMGSERREQEGIQDVNMEIRSHSNGWVFARDGVSIPEVAKDLAIKAVAYLGLVFGAVDIAITPTGGVKIFEINSAPGLEGTTLLKYKEAFIEHINNG